MIQNETLVIKQSMSEYRNESVTENTRKRELIYNFNGILFLGLMLQYFLYKYTLCFSLKIVKAIPVSSYLQQ